VNRWPQRQARPKLHFSQLGRNQTMKIDIDKLSEAQLID